MEKENRVYNLEDLLRDSPGALIGVGQKIDRLTVQKSIALLNILHEMDIGTTGYKIVETYLARINSRKPEQRDVIFERGELEKLFGVTKIKNEKLDEALEVLMSQVNLAKVGDMPARNYVARLNLFDYAYGFLNSATGRWTVRLKCSDTAMRYIFDIEDKGYISYKLKTVASLGSSYAYHLYMYVEANRFKHLTWDVSIDELKKKLKCDEAAYSTYGRFNDLVLKKARKELIEKTECDFEYKANRTGRYVSSLTFTIHPSTKAVPNIDVTGELPITKILGIESSSIPASEKKKLELYSGALDNMFSALELRELSALLVSMPEEKLPKAKFMDKDSVDIRRYNYLHEKYTQLMRIDAKTPIKDKLAYLKRMIRSDMEKPIENPTSSSAAAAKSSVKTYKNFRERQDNNYTQMILDRYSKKNSEQETGHE